MCACVYVGHRLHDEEYRDWRLSGKYRVPQPTAVSANEIKDNTLEGIFFFIVPKGSEPPTATSLHPRTDIRHIGQSADYPDRTSIFSMSWSV